MCLLYRYAISYTLSHVCFINQTILSISFIDMNIQSCLYYFYFIAIDCKTKYLELALLLLIWTMKEDHRCLYCIIWRHLKSAKIVEQSYWRQCLSSRDLSLQTTSIGSILVELMVRFDYLMAGTDSNRSEILAKQSHIARTWS